MDTSNEFESWETLDDMAFSEDQLELGEEVSGDGDAETRVDLTSKHEVKVLQMFREE